MKSFAFAVALACGFVIGGAHAAMTLSPRGTGQVLLYPAYSVIGGQSTLVTLVNTSARAKAVQLTFREGYMGREVITVRLFLGPRDVWNGTAFQLSTVSQEPALIASDRSCAVPVTIGGTLPLPDGRIAWQFSRANIGDLPIALALYKPWQGSIEAIELGEIKSGSALAAAVTAANGQPPSCAGVDSADLSTALDPPGGKLYGSFALVNAGAGSIFSGNATAIDGFSVTSLGGLPLADLAQGRTSAGAADPVEARVDVDGRQVVVKYPRERAIDAVSALLMADAVSGEFVVDPIAGAKTDWVLTMPTRRYYVDPAAGGQQTPPFNGLPHMAPGGPCSYYDVDVRDRDQNAITPQSTYVPGSPPTPTAVRHEGTHPSILFPIVPTRSAHALCTPSEVIAFSRFANGPNAPRMSGVVQNYQLFELLDANVTATGGAARLQLGAPDPAAPGGGTQSILPAGVEGPALRGTPVIGFAATLYINGVTVPGFAISYTSAVPLHTEAACATSTGAVAACP